MKSNRNNYYMIIISLLYTLIGSQHAIAATPNDDLKNAINSGDIDLLNAIVSTKPDMNYNDCSRCDVPKTPFYYALKTKNPKVIDIILNNGADLDRSAIIALQILKDDDELQMLNKLIGRGYKSKDNYGLLYNAWNSGSPNTFQTVLKKQNWDVNKPLNGRSSLFESVVLYDKTNIVKQIHNMGGKITNLTVEHAVRRGKEDTFIYLVDNVKDKASLKKIFQKGKISSSYIDKGMGWSNKKVSTTYNYLGYLTHCYPKHCFTKPKILKKLLNEFDVNPTKVIGYKGHPVKEIVFNDYGRHDQTERLGMMFLFFDKGVDPNITFGRHRVNILNRLVTNGADISIFKKFLSYKPIITQKMTNWLVERSYDRDWLKEYCDTDVDQKDLDKKKRFIERFNLYVDAGANVNDSQLIKDVVDKGLLDTFNYMVSKGAKVNYVYGQNKTSLITYAARISSYNCRKKPEQEHPAYQIIHALVKAGANVNAQDVNKQTALHEMAESGNLIAVKALLDAGADKSIKNAKNYTPLIIAKLKKHKDIVKMLTNK